LKRKDEQMRETQYRFPQDDLYDCSWKFKAPTRIFCMNHNVVTEILRYFYERFIACSCLSVAFSQSSSAHALALLRSRHSLLSSYNLIIVSRSYAMFIRLATSSRLTDIISFTFGWVPVDRANLQNLNDVHWVLWLVCMYKGWAFTALAPRPTVVYCARFFDLLVPAKKTESNKKSLIFKNATEKSSQVLGI
jgi:hypothetical protein